MEYIVCAILILIIILSIRELLKTKKMQNDSTYNIYRNSRYYRLLLITIVSIIGIRVYFVRLFMEAIK